MTTWSYEVVLDKIDKVKSAESLLDIAFSTFKNLNIPRFVYIFLPQDTHYNRGAIDILQRGYIDNLCIFVNQLEVLSSTSAGAKYLKLKAASCTSVFTERDYYAESLFTSVNASDPKHANYWKHRQGLMIPVHSAHSNTGFFCIPTEGAEPDSKRKRKLQLLCQGFHQRYCELWTLPEKRQIKLTNRERDILTWMTLGKSNGVIADIIGLSKHTVDSYIRRLFLKLDVNDRISAVIKAYEIGLLHEDIVRTSKAYSD